METPEAMLEIHHLLELENQEDQMLKCLNQDSSDYHKIKNNFKLLNKIKKTFDAWKNYCKIL